MSTLHVSEDGRGMLDLVDKLRNIDKIEKTVPLPQIVVVGQQSSGKSSVLQAISGIQFPIDDGLCTQFPTEIILRREQVIRTKASIRPTPDTSEQQRSNFESFEARWHNTELSNLKHIISDAKKILQLNDRKRFSAESLVLEISGPDQEHLTLIDLPGFFVSTQTGQSSSDIGLVNEIAKRYVSNSRAVVLAVISGRNDFENQLILENLKLDVDFRKRTLGVITAPDAIEPGSRREDECVQLIQHDPRGLGYGWHVLRNLKYSEVKAGTFDRDAVETHFFEQTTPWNRLSSTCVGNQALKKRLSLILKKKIAESLPEIQQEVDLKLEQIYTQLEALGKARQSPGEFREYLCERARMFEIETGAMLSGSPPQSMDRFTVQNPSLRAFVQKEHEVFAAAMFDEAQTWKLDVNGKDTPEYLRQIWSGHATGTAVIPPDIMATMLFDEVSQHRGRELSNLLHPDWASTIFRRQSQRWLKIAKSHGDNIYLEMSNRIYEAVEKVVEEDTADRLLNEIIEPALRERKRMLDEKIKELYRPYSLPSIYCVSRKYKGLVNEMVIKEGVYEYTQCCNMLRSAEAFYQVAVDVFTENVVSLGVESCLLNDLSAILNQKLFYQMTDDRLELLGGESDEMKQTRSQLLAEKKQFEEARDQILPAFSKQRSRPAKKVQLPQQNTLVVEVFHDAPTGDKPYSVEITAATPPMTPARSIAANKTPSSSKSPMVGSAPPKLAGSPGHETTPASSIGSHSSSGHSRSTSSISSYGGSPVQSKTKNVRSLSSGASPVPIVAGSNPRVLETAHKVDFGAKNDSVMPVLFQHSKKSPSVFSFSLPGLERSLSGPTVVQSDEK